MLIQTDWKNVYHALSKIKCVGPKFRTSFLEAQPKVSRLGIKLSKEKIKFPIQKVLLAKKFNGHSSNGCSLELFYNIKLKPVIIKICSKLVYIALFSNL